MPHIAHNTVAGITVNNTNLCLNAVASPHCIQLCPSLDLLLTSLCDEGLSYHMSHQKATFLKGQLIFRYLLCSQ